MENLIITDLEPQKSIIGMDFIELGYAEEFDGEQVVDFILKQVFTLFERFKPA